MKTKHSYKKIARLVINYIAVLSLIFGSLVVPVLADNQDNQEFFDLIEITKEDAKNIIGNIKDENVHEKLESCDKIFLNGDGRLVFSFSSTITDSADTSSRGLLSDNFPIADNINLLLPRSPGVSGCTVMWSKPCSFDQFDNRINGYGVVNAYRSNSNSNIWFLEMNSNIRPSSRYYAVTQLMWVVNHDNSSTVLMDWSPKTTTVTSSDGFPITVSLKIPNTNYTIGTSFKILKNKATLAPGASLKQYYVNFTTSPTGVNPSIYYPYYQDLNAVTYYNLGGFTTWNWDWYWNTNWVY